MTNEHNIDSQFNACMHKEYCLSLKAQIRPLDENAPPAAAPAPASTQDEPFGYFRAEPFGWTDCAATDEGAIALYERPAAPAVPNVMKRGYGRLIQAAADLALQQYMPSDIVDDYPSKTISAAKVAKMMTQPRDRLRLLSIEVSEGAKQMLAAAPAAPSQEPVTLTNEGNRALQVMRWIDSGEWTLKKSRPSSLLTDEANAERAWFVERQAEPYCDNKGNRRWFGCTAFEAFTIAIAALREKEQA